MNIIMLGATSGMGRAVARKYAGRGDALFLLGRDSENLKRSAADLRQRGASFVGCAECDLAERQSHESALKAAWEALEHVDAVIVSAGAFGVQEELESNLERAAEVMRINFSGTIEFCEAARKRLLAAGGGSLAVFSSVAGDRARKPVVIYGATKAGLSAYLEGIDLRYGDDGLHVLNVKPGFVGTSMTEGLKPPPFAGDVESVAKLVVRAIDRKENEVYAPTAWKYVMGVVKRIPRGIMKKLSF